VKCRSHLHQASDFDPQVIASRKLHQIVCKSEPSMPINGIRLGVSPTFLGFAAELICLEVRHRMDPADITPTRSDYSKKRYSKNEDEIDGTSNRSKL
jgi:hypothetical protein